MDLTQLADLSIWMIAKIAVLVFLAIYIGFSVVVVKQAKLMTETLNVDFGKIINTVALILLTMSVVIFILSLLFL